MTQDANFAATLSRWARATPDRTALIEPGRRDAGAPTWRSVTFGELDALADSYAAGLARSGVRAGDRVLYLLRPSVEGYAIFYALLRLGTAQVFIDPRMSLPRLLGCIRTAGARVIVAVPVFHILQRLAPRAFAAAELSFSSGPAWLGGAHNLRRCRADDGSYMPAPVGSDDPCSLPFTSGSTGTAKGVIYTHRLMHAQADLVRQVCGWRAGMRVVMCFGPFVAFGLADGLTVILPDMDFSRPAAAKPARVVEALTAHGAEYAFASPIVWRNLARYCEQNGVTLPTLRHALAAGAPVPVDLHRRLRALIHPEGRLHTPYGATEAMPVTTTDSTELVETWAATNSGQGICVGRPLPGIEVRVIKVTDQPLTTWSEDLVAPHGSVGELVVGGQVVSPAYLDQPEETARARIRRDGVSLHRMGDLGRIDADGRIWFCGRKAHRIETSWGMLASMQLENVFNQHPDVFRTAVVGIGAPGAATPVACVQLEPGVKFTARLQAQLIELSDATCFKGMVTRFLVHSGFPVDRRHNSKIDREALTAWAAGKIDRERVR